VRALEAIIRRIDPRVRFEGHEIELDATSVAALYADCEVVVEAFDAADAKRMIVETVLTRWPDKPIIVGSGLAGYGRNNAMRERRTGKLIVCGDEESAVSSDAPPLAPRVAIAAAMQANAVLEILLDGENGEEKEP
jgi:sulfur carrier protein ThiS adenylyltransferase